MQQDAPLAQPRRITDAARSTATNVSASWARSIRPGVSGFNPPLFNPCPMFIPTTTANATGLRKPGVTKIWLWVKILSRARSVWRFSQAELKRKAKSPSEAEACGKLEVRQSNSNNTSKTTPPFAILAVLYPRHGILVFLRVGHVLMLTSDQYSPPNNRGGGGPLQSDKSPLSRPLILN